MKVFPEIWERRGVRSSSPHASKRGVALVLVLAFLVLITALVIAFFSSVTTELSGAKSYAAGISSRQLSDFTVQIVQAQINAATTSGNSQVWSSQPGLIRTFNNTGSAAASYKLYSSGTMLVSGALNPSTNSDVSSSWYENAALYTDLNAPVAAVSGTVWPILDPSYLASSATASVPQGFSVSGSAPVGNAQGITNPAPMPVQWLYVLRDSTVIAPDPGSTTSATFNGSPKKPSASNPIVGRIAFWTDDETCKVNVNTASEGMYWDIPRFYTTQDQNLGISQPVRNEFQGYPGHPAGISLSSVFPQLVGSVPASALDPFYAIAPRIERGGSLNGTVTSSTSMQPVSLDGDRLYDSENEVAFNSARAANAGLTAADIRKAGFFLTAHNRAPETTPFGTPKIVCWPIHADLANNAASPYVSAFDRLIARCGTVNGDKYYFQRQNKNDTTADYQNIARNRDLYTYLQKLLGTPVPGFGGNLSTKFGADSDQILTEIFDYIRCTNLNDLNLSSSTYQYGVGNTSSYNYGGNQVLPIEINNTRGFGRVPTITEAALWIICTADPTVTGTTISTATSSTTTTVVVSNTSTNLTLASGTSSGATLLTTSATTKQIRIEAALMLDPFLPVHGPMVSHPDIMVTIEGMELWSVKGDSDTDPISWSFPSKGEQTTASAGQYLLGAGPSWLGTYDTGGYLGAAYAWSQRGSRARGRLPQDGQFATGHPNAAATVRNAQYPFLSLPVTVNVSQSAPQLTFSGGEITLTILQANTGTSNAPVEVQKLKLKFPATTFRAPSLNASTPGYWTFQAGGCGVTGASTTVGTTGTSTAAVSGTAGRLSLSTKGPTVDINNDVILSVVAAKADSSGNTQTLDPRLLAMTGTDTNGALFAPHPYYLTGTAFANTLIADPFSGMPYCPSRGNPNLGSLANLGSNKVPFRYWPTPKVPYEARAAMDNGDWDNGLGNLADGGFVNAPDQGNIDSSWATPYYSNHYVMCTSFTSPSRMLPSPGMFGSLPTGVKRGQGWQTLLFRRQPGHPAYSAGAGAFTNDPDYLLMDLFWMPVVEPYAISDVLSTSGKINMNYQIVPFGYIERSTGLYAALKREKAISVPNADYAGYKYKSSGFDTSAQYRRPIQIQQTLEQFRQRFDNTDGTGLFAFRTPSEICDLHFIPDDVTGLDTSSKTSIDNTMATYWRNHALTGDNSRERIYTTVYPRLTTRSNTYTVHYRAQSLQQTLTSQNSGQWVEGRDKVTGEYRGSTLIERYIDPSNANLPHFAPNPGTATLEPYYSWRVVSSRKFAP